MAVIPIHIVPFPDEHPLHGYAFRYVNYSEGRRKKSNEEIYEGNIRSDFSTHHKTYTYDSVSVVKI